MTISLADWATAAPSDVVATATGELAGTTASATYGGPYDINGSGQQLGPLALQPWAGVRIPSTPTRAWCSARSARSPATRP